MAPPVFKTGLAGIAFAGRFDSFPSPPNSMLSIVDANQRLRSKCATTTSEY